VDFYPWVVFAHVVLVIVAFGAHGVSAFAMFAAKREPDRARLAAILDMSTMSVTLAGVALLVTAVLGIVAAAMAGYFGRLWPWVAIVVVVLVFIAMTPMAAIPMGNVRKALGMRVSGDKKDDPPREPGTDAEVAAAQAKLRPELVASIGLVGIGLLVWLMEFKPF
jgi:small-conductance mechanosensitive channel